MDRRSPPRVRLSPEDPIEKLDLSTRPFNALRRSGVRTVGQLVQLRESGRVLEIRYIGVKSLAEIEDCLADVDLLDEPRERETATAQLDTIPSRADTATPVEAAPTVSLEVIRWQTGLIKRQISMGLLHEQARVAGNPIAHWVAIADTMDRDRAHETLATLLLSSVNVCEELEFLLLTRVPRRDHLRVLLSRYGLQPRTLEDIGQELGVTRERIRQIGVRLKTRIEAAVDLVVKAESASSLLARPALLRIQSALHIARDMKMDITYEQWKSRISQSGLVGSWTAQGLLAVDPVEAMIAVCNLLADSCIRELRAPRNLQYAVELAASGSPGMQARVLHVRNTLPKDVKRLVKRHARFSGGVHVRWLSQETGIALEEMKDILRGLRYRPISADWFASSALGELSRISRHDVFHRALRKMFQYCGPLSVDDVCAGVRSVASRTTFPVPPPDAMEEMLRACGYQQEEGRYYWAGGSDEGLCKSETIIMDCLDRAGPVLHHAELAQAFVDSELSFPSLHGALGRSPLFERIETGLYKLRGMPVARQDIERAKIAGERIPTNPEIEYDKAGSVVVEITMGVIALGTGSILCEHFPNLSGRWDCFVRGEQTGELQATDSEFRHLSRAFESLGCKPGDRLRFTFNTWNRTVTVEGIGDRYANP